MLGAYRGLREKQLEISMRQFDMPLKSTSSN
jgi:hypothetical protein